MEALIIGFIWILNLAISYWNARVVGMCWSDLKQMGGWQRFMGWMVTIQSASGFTWCYMIVLLLGAFYFQPAAEPGQQPWILPEHVHGGLSLGYLLVLPGILFSGLMIWVDSMVRAWKRRDLASVGIAAWNTYAQVHNTVSAVSAVPDAVTGVGRLFKGDSKAEHKAVLAVVILVILSLVGGILTTYAIIQHYAKR